MNSLRRSWPRRRTWVPGFSLSASQAWLNQTAVISPLPSVILRLDDGEAPARTANRRANDLAGDRDLLLAGQEVGDANLLRRSLVPERPMGEQVADRAQAELGELLRQRRADAGERPDAVLEPLRAGKPSWTGPCRWRRRIGERGRKSSRQSEVEYRTGRSWRVWRDIARRRGAMLVPRPRTQGVPVIPITGATEDPVSG